MTAAATESTPNVRERLAMSEDRTQVLETRVVFLMSQLQTICNEVGMLIPEFPDAPPSVLRNPIV